MDQDEKVTQALNNFLTVFAGYYDSYFNGPCEIFQATSGDIMFAYKQWLDASKPPGDPHKEWVDASIIKPGVGKYPVLVKTTTRLYAHLGHWWRTSDKWEIQPMGEKSRHVPESSVTHWRYIPEDDND